MFGALASLLSSDLAIDLGTANTLIFMEGKGIVCNEPSVVAVQTATKSGRRKIIAVGTEAKNMMGRCPESVVAIRPLRDGSINDFEIAEELLRHLIHKVHHRKNFVRPRIVICVPPSITAVEKRAVKEAAISAGAREVHLIPEPMAAAIGAGLPVTEASGSMVLDIGGGTSEVAVISLKGIVYAKNLRMGGNKMDEAIISNIRRKHGILIGERTAEQLKTEIGSVLPSGMDLQLEINGRDVVLGVPRTVVVGEEDVREALIEPINQVVGMVKDALENTPPELSADIVDRGLRLTGGGAMLRGIDRYLTQKIGLTVTIPEEPLEAVVRGSGAVLNQLGLLRDIVLH